MRVLIVKTSSLGDVIHTLPALTDAVKAIPNIQFDWVVEESFQDVTRWHTAVKNVLPVALRRFRKNPLKTLLSGEMIASFFALRQQKYDLIIDAQGLFKSLILAWIAKGPLAGFDRYSAREKWTSYGYRRKIHASWNEHAVQRTRRLFAEALGYPLPAELPDYGIDLTRLPPFRHPTPYYVFLHGTTWDNKHWPEDYWIALAQKSATTDATLLLLWGNEKEKERAERIAASVYHAKVLPKLGLEAIAGVLAFAKGIVSLDTGLGHLAAALAVPTVSLYGPTDPNKTGTYGKKQIHLAANFSCAPCLSRHCRYSKDQLQSIHPPCFSSVTPDLVWQTLLKQSEAVVVERKE